MCVWSAFIGKKQAAPEVWKTEELLKDSGADSIPE